MDHQYSIYLHGNPCLIDIVDQKWSEFKLEYDELHLNEDFPLEDIIAEETPNNEFIWNERQEL